MANILVVEDHPDVLEMMVVCLRKNGHTVLAASTLRAASHILSYTVVDLLVTDYRLPDGVATEFLLNMGRKAPMLTLLITGYCRVDKQDMFDMVLCKPVTCTTICKSVLAVLNGGLNHELS